MLTSANHAKMQASTMRVATMAHRGGIVTAGCTTPCVEPLAKSAVPFEVPRLRVVALAEAVRGFLARLEVIVDVAGDDAKVCPRWSGVLQGDALYGLGRVAEVVERQCAAVWQVVLVHPIRHDAGLLEEYKVYSDAV